MELKTIRSVEEFQKIPKHERKFAYLETRAMDAIEVGENYEPIIPFQENPEEGLRIFFEPNNEYSARKTVTEKVYQAARNLPDGIHFMLYSGFRPIEVQRKLFDEIYAEFKKEKPELNEQELWEYTTRMIADPSGCPPHTTGGAVDLTLCDSSGNELDMGGKVDHIDNCETFCDGLNGEQKRNRDILFEAMTGAGFVNLPTEWWHYSYGDRYWAAYNELPETLYSPRHISECPGNYTR